LLREALENARRFLGTGHYETGYYMTSLAAVLYQRAQYVDAEKKAREAIAILQKTLPDDHAYIASAKHWLGEILLKENNPLEAKGVLETALIAWNRSKSAPWLAARTESALGEALLATGHGVEGLRHLKIAYAVLRQARGTDDVDTQTALARMGHGQNALTSPATTASDRT
jgi:tetratricopeptide (TPR) repeat protein